MDSVNRILERLYERRGSFCPVEELGRDCGLGRERVEEAMGVLERRGQGVEREPGRGVRLAEPIRMDAHLITRGLETARVGRDAVCFGEVGSTNDVARGAAVGGRCDGLVVTAESQTAGRGRQGRTWVSGAGRNILASVVLLQEAGELAAPSTALRTAEAVTIAAGLAIAQGVEDACGLRCSLKWPNDVLLEGAKAAGVLVEAVTLGARGCLVVGFGVNVNEGPPAGQVDRAATCLREHAAGAVERIEVLRRVLARLDGWVGAIGEGKLGRLHDEWVGRCGMMNQRVTVLSEGRRVTGRVLDVSPLEGLVLMCDSGQTVRLAAGGATVV